MTADPTRPPLPGTRGGAPAFPPAPAAAYPFDPHEEVTAPGGPVPVRPLASGPRRDAEALGRRSAADLSAAGDSTLMGSTE